VKAEEIGGETEGDFTDNSINVYIIYVNNSLVISICIFMDLPQQKNTRALCPRSSPNLICSHIPMEIFLFYETVKK
jgi:hypothetical protein